ncbi:hypothetical protein V8E36_009442 [Tilletia maclaganii]
MTLNALGIVSFVFLVLYAILFVALLYGFATAQLKFKSRWSLVLFHVTLRLAAQSVGIAFAVIGYKDAGLLIAYLVLGAEGFFSLVLCTSRFLVSFHNHTFGDSWLEPKAHRKLPLSKRIGSSFVISKRARKRQYANGESLQTNWMAFVHWLLIAGNTIIITGGSMLSNAVDSSNGTLIDPQKYHTGKAMRAAGQAIFLAIMVALLGAIILTIKQYRAKAARNGHKTPVHGHLFLLILLAVSPFLLVRGIFGVLQAVVESLGYYSPSTYEPGGLATEFVVKEGILAIAMEWTTCAFLLTTWPVIKMHGWQAEKTLPAASTPHELEEHKELSSPSEA